MAESFAGRVQGSVFVKAGGRKLRGKGAGVSFSRSQWQKAL